MMKVKSLHLIYVFTKLLRVNYKIISCEIIFIQF